VHVAPNRGGACSAGRGKPSELSITGDPLSVDPLEGHAEEGYNEATHVQRGVT
jgi:hypothetical protein